MSIFKMVNFAELFNPANTPAAGIDRFGYPIKQLMLQLQTNDLYILDENNIIYPLSAKYASFTDVEKLKQQISIISGQIKGGLAWKGYQPNIHSKQQLAQKYPTPSNGDIYTIADGRQYIYIGSGLWQQLGVNYDYLKKRFIPSGCTADSLSNYIAISQWNKLISACSPGVYDALNTIIASKSQPKTTNFDEFFTYCIDAGVTASAAFKFAENNYELIKKLPSTIISSIVSGGQLDQYLASYLAASSVLKPSFDALSSSHDLLINKLISNQQQLEENLSALQKQLDRVNNGLSSIYSTI